MAVVLGKAQGYTVNWLRADLGKPEAHEPHVADGPGNLDPAQAWPNMKCRSVWCNVVGWSMYFHAYCAMPKTVSRGTPKE